MKNKKTLDKIVGPFFNNDSEKYGFEDKWKEQREPILERITLLKNIMDGKATTLEKQEVQLITEWIEMTDLGAQVKFLKIQLRQLNHYYRKYLDTQQ
tara:strand:+ start:486 stop:776 length:291 start_codon:yes stop_codon:yes gene_type:complete